MNGASDRRSVAAEFPMLGVLLHEYRDAVNHVEGCLLAAASISQPVDPERAAVIDRCRIAVMQGLSIIDDLLARDATGRKES